MTSSNINAWKKGRGEREERREERGKRKEERGRGRGEEEEGEERRKRERRGGRGRGEEEEGEERGKKGREEREKREGGRSTYLSSSTLANPKSVSLMWPVLSRRIFSGFRSLW